MRWLRRLLVAVAFVPLAAALILANTWAFLRSSWGAEILAERVEAVTADLFLGTIRIGRLGTFGALGFRLQHVLVIDPEGNPVIAVRDLRVKLDPWWFLVGRLVADVRVRDGRMALVMLPAWDDVNVGIAFAPRHPREIVPRRREGPPPPLPPEPPVPIVLRSLRVDDTAFLLRQGPGEPVDVLVRDIAVRSAGRWNRRGASADLRLRAQTLLPVQAPLTAEVAGAFAQNWLDALGVEIRLGGTRLSASGRGEMRALQGRVVVEGNLGAAELRSIDLPIANDVALTGDVWLGVDRSTAALRLTAGGGAAAFDAWYQRDTHTMFAQAILAEIDPSAWIDGAPPGSLSGSARIVGPVVPDLDLHVGLHLLEGTLLGSSVGPASIDGRLEGDRFQLAPSSLVLPGVRLRASGSASPRALDVRGTLEAHDLAAAARFGADLARTAPPPVAGHGSVRFQIVGSPSSPVAAAHFELPRLRWSSADARAVDLRGNLRLDDAGLPVGTLGGGIGRLQTQRLDARSLAIDARRDGSGEFSLDLRGRTRLAGTADLGATELHVRGDLQPDRAVLQRFAFRYPEGAMRSEGEATVYFGGGRLGVENFALRQRGGGRLHVRGGVAGRRLDLEAQGKDLRLDRLPQALLPETLAGTVELDAAVRGTLERPLGSARFQLRRGRFGALRDLAGSGDVRFEAGRAEGTVQAALGGAGLVEGSFAGPLDLLHAPARERFDVDLRVGPVDLAGLGAALGMELPRATLRARVAGQGELGAPDLDVHVLVGGLEIPGAPTLPRLAAQLDGTLHEGYAVSTLEAWAGDARILELEARAPLDPRRLRLEPERELERMLRSGRSRAQGTLRGLDLAVVGALVDQPDLAGAVVAEFDVQGPIVDPRGRVRLDARAGPLGPLRRLSFGALVELLPERSRLIAGVAVDDQPPAEIRASVDAPPRAFLDGTAPASTPAELVIDVPELRLGEIGGRATTARARGLVAGTTGTERDLGGTVRAQARFAGTLADLPGTLRVVAQDLVVHGVPLGSAELSIEQAQALSAWLAAIDPTAGTLTARANLDGAVSPLGLARRGVELLRGMRAEVEAQGTALSLGPLAIVSSINRASGELDFVARAHGPVFALDPVGQVSLRDGAVELVGGPRYENVRLDARMTGERLVLAQLEASAPGQGRLVADGRMQRTPGPNPFSFQVRSDAFPIGGPGGVSARVTAEGRIDGTFDVQQGLRAKLLIPGARIFLPRTPPRELQPVSRLRDVVIVTGPEAYLRQRRQRRATQQTALPMRVDVEAQRIFVTGTDVDAELAADLQVRRNGAGDLVARGEVRARRGSVRVLGRPFTIEEAAATWGGGPITEPNLALTARYQATDVTAWVDVAGTPSAPEIGLRSDPPLPESQIALLIASGRTSLPGQSSAFEPQLTETPAEVTAAGAAVSVAGSFAAQRLKQAIGPRLPLDVLTLETGGEGTRLEAGTYVSRRLYLGYLRNFLPEEGENANEVRADYELSRTVSVESRFGDRGAAGVDLVWEKRIATPAQQRARRQAREERREQREPGSSAPEIQR